MSTVVRVLEGMTMPSMRTGSTALGWRMRRNSAAMLLVKMAIRLLFMAPLDEPPMAPKYMEKPRIIHTHEGHVE